MLKVHVAQHHAEAHLVTALLQARGIAAEVRGEALFTTLEASAIIPGAAPEVWIADPTQEAEARELVRLHVKGLAFPEGAGPTWRCPACGETHEAQFTACWKCDTVQPGASS